MSSTPRTALVLLDVYNDFLHPSGKIYPHVSESLATTNTITHLFSLVSTARSAKLPIYYALHQTWKPENYSGWQHMNGTTSAISKSHAMEEGSWGAKIYEGLEPNVEGGDVVVGKHWNSRSIALLLSFPISAYLRVHLQIC
jgi:nicotinamidase-related amidase